MRWQTGAGFAIAALVHGLALFAVRVGTPARTLPSSDEPDAVDVSLVAAAPAAEAAPSAEPSPAETPQPEPQPTPQEAPAPTPSASPVPAPEATPVNPVANDEPRPQATPALRPRHHAFQKRSARRPASAAAAAMSNAGETASHGASSRVVTSRARYLSNPQPEYPPEALRQHEEGVVLVSVDVGTDGHPRDVTLAKSSGFPLLDARRAVAGVRRWRFEPARAGGLAVESRAVVPVRFIMAR